MIGLGFLPALGGGGIALLNTVDFTAGSGTYTVPAGVSQIVVTVIGGGGAGGGGVDIGTNAGGGGGGAIAQRLYATSPGTNYNYSIGAGG